jgi:hypothetical protein
MTSLQDFEINKSPLSEYKKAFRNLQTRRRMKSVTPGLAKEKTGAIKANQVPHLQEDASKPELSARMGSIDDRRSRLRR